MVSDRSITLPANLDVVLGRLLRFLLERVEYINCLLELGNIENTIGIVSMNANFLTTRTHGVRAHNLHNLAADTIFRMPLSPESKIVMIVISAPETHLSRFDFSTLVSLPVFSDASRTMLPASSNRIPSLSEVAGLHHKVREAYEVAVAAE